MTTDEIYAIMEGKMTEWTSIRKAYPDVAGNYDVMDCRRGNESTGYYDGHDFTKVKMPLQGSLILQDFFVSHWKVCDE